MVDVTCAVNPLPTPQDAERMYLKVRKELHGLGADAYKREAARRMGLDYDTYANLRAAKKGTAKKATAPKPVTPAPPEAMVKAVANTGKPKRGATHHQHGTEIIIDGRVIGYVRKYEKSEPVMASGRSYSVGSTKRIVYDVKNPKGIRIESIYQQRTQQRAIDKLVEWDAKQAKPGIGDTKAGIPEVKPTVDVNGKVWSHDQAVAHYQKYINDLDYKATGAIEEYTVTTFEPINRVLRTGRVVSDTEQIALDYYEIDFTGADLKNRISLLKKSIDDAPPLQEPMKVYRGTMVGTEGDVYKVGSIITDNGFASTSINVDTPLEMATMASRSDHVLMMEIDLPVGSKAMYLEPLTQYESQFEVLLQAGARFRVKERIDLTKEQAARRYGHDPSDGYIDTPITVVRMELIP